MMSSDSALLHVLGHDAAVLQKVRKAKILLVGAGGIGCEVIKTLLLTGFTDVHVIDLDTIDVSNLNRQFLFNKTHVGKGKAEVAAAVAVARFAHKDVDGISVRPDKTEIQHKEFTFDFFRSFTFVINALDNRAARSHVNRMCLAADVPLIESGSEGYQGQVYLIKKGVSMCYECDGPKQEQKTFASCTIRNTPSLPIHCIVWAKHLFSQLFGEQDADNDVSPDITDPELQQPAQTNGDSGTKSHNSCGSTRQWAASHDYDPDLLFDKFFDGDIHTLLAMDKLWESRRKPTPLSRADLLNDRVHEAGTSGAATNGHSGDLKEQRVWSLRECYDVFRQSVTVLKNQLNQMNNDSESAKDKFLVWDKDDEAALSFVTAVSNLRSFCFAIERKSRFDVKSMAGNIIPAIASTNSIVGGLIVLQTLSLLRKLPETREEMTALTKQQREQIFRESCRHIYLRIVSQNAKNLVAAYELFEPKSDCFVCSSGSRELEITCCFTETRLADLVQIVMKKLHFVCPDIQVDGTATLLYNKEDADEESDEERIESEKRLLSDFNDLHHNVRLKVYDLTQNHTVLVVLKNEKVDPNQNDGQHFRIVVLSEGTDENGKESNEQTATAPAAGESEPMTTASEVTLSDDESNPIEVEKVKQTDVALKRAPVHSNGSEVVTPPKKMRTDSCE
jgi:ubiquitin-like 1-activating enzyme E1 B